jgi:glutathione S-transferase
MTDAVLWHIEVSHYNEKARWALDYKGIPHERRAPLPGLTGLWAGALTRGKSRRVPVLRLDGRIVADSTAIIAALEEHQPDPPLYPADPAERTRALDLEDFFDEELAPAIRSFMFAHTLASGDGMADALLPNASPARRRFLRASMPLVRPAIRADLSASKKTEPEKRAKIVAAMDRLETELGGSEYLVGDSFTVADLTAAALFTPLIAPPERPYLPQNPAPEILAFRAEMEARPGGQWVLETYRRHRPASAEVAA